MSKQKQKPRQSSEYVKQMMDIIDQYVEETGETLYDLHEVAAWAHRKKKLEPRPRNIIIDLAKQLAAASRQDYVKDANGESVRQRHAVRKKINGEQMTFWFMMEDGTPEDMRLSAQNRRRGALADVLQIDRDIRYYNKNYNPGDPIQLDFNYNKDIEERQLPTEYPDSPPVED